MNPFDKYIYISRAKFALAIIAVIAILLFVFREASPPEEKKEIPVIVSSARITYPVGLDPTISWV